MIKLINNKLVFNVIGFYICWWISIYGAIIEIYCIGPLVTILFILLHFFKVVDHHQEDIFLVICFFLGTFIETTLLNLNVIIHKGVLVEFNIAPIWAISLWVCFGSTVFHSFKWMSKQYLTCAILGALSSPIIYFSLKSLGVLSFGIGNAYVLMLTSMTWALFIPIFIYISDKILES